MPRTQKAIRDESLLSAALEGLELQRRRIEEQIQEVRLLLGKGAGRRGRPPGPGHKRGPGRMSEAARRRIGAAQKRRWAEYRKATTKAE
jgi:hypothetical protein